jgi:hypothetical protein
LDWARDVQFVGRGNQITERALLLRHLVPEDAMEAFLAGDVEAWNPFVLTTQERLFFLFHLLEIDRVTSELINDLAKLEPGTVVESSDAGRLLCHALFRVLDGAVDKVEPRDLPAYRTARELACTIARELDLSEYVAGCEGATGRRPPKPPKPVRQGGMLNRARSGKPRKTTKNADHQAIPRFEQLVDLGFLSKPAEGEGDDLAQHHAGRRRWRYTATEACRRWGEARTRLTSAEERFEWHGFAHAAVHAFRPQGDAVQDAPNMRTVASYLWRAYERVGRPMGHTPLDSVALCGTLMASTDGVAVEMSAFNRLLLSIKQQGRLQEHVFFASGNELDTMFVQLKPGFLEQLGDPAGTLGLPEA